MFLFFISSLIILIGSMFVQMKHPLAMGLTLLFQTVLISIYTGMVNKSFWYSYILYLVFLGGMLVLFIYVTSLASNEMFNLSGKMFMMSLCLMVLMMSIILLLDPFSLNFMNNLEGSNIQTNIMLMEETPDMLIKLYNRPNNLITILLINYLLITLIAVVKITKNLNGPLRPMN